MIKSEIKNYNLTLTVQEQKYMHYHQVSEININMLQRLCILLAQVQAGSTSENLLNFWGQNKFQRMYTITYLYQYSNECGIHEFREKQDL